MWLATCTVLETFRYGVSSRYTKRVKLHPSLGKGESPKEPRRAALKWVFGVVVSSLFVGCLAPTLPLPPPARPEITAPDESGMVHIRGSVRSGAEVFAKNRRTLQIVGEETDETGDYDLVMAAESNDRIVVWYTDGVDDSDLVEVLVPDDAPGDGGASNE